MADDCPNCRRNQMLASQMRGLADAILVGGLTAAGVPVSVAAAAPEVVERTATKVARGKARGSNSWNEFLKRYVANYKRNNPRGRKSFGTLSKEAARKWRRQNR